MTREHTASNPRRHPHECGLDPIRDRAVETADEESLQAMIHAAWIEQRDHVAAHSQFYRRKFDDADVDLASVERIEDLARLPFTTKDELRASQDAEPPFGLHLATDPESVKRVFQTSGTSGAPSVIALTSRDIETWTKIGSRTYYTTGLHPHNSVATMFGAGPFVAGQTHDVIKAIGSRSVPIGPGDTERLLRALRNGLADTLLLTPSFALYLADRLHQDGVDAQTMGVRRLMAGGEPGAGLPEIRASMSDLWDADVMEVMGLGDISPSLFGECHVGDGMHFCGQGMVWPELVDATGERIPIEAGAEGELVYTSLQREAMPLVRFRSGDHVRIIETACTCGRNSFTMRIAGRTDDMFIVRGVNVYPSAVQAIVGEFRPTFTGRSRVVLPPGAVVVDPPVQVEVEVGDAAEAGLEAAAERLERELRAKLTFRGEVVLVPADVFGDAGYKTKPVVRRPRDR